MSYGSSDWEKWVLDEEESLPILEHAYKRGITTWDTVSSMRLVSSASLDIRPHQADDIRPQLGPTRRAPTG